MLVEDHQILREGLICLMRNEPGLEVVGQAGDGLAAVAKARELQPEVIVMNTCLPGLNGIEATRRICNQQPEVKVLCRSMQDDSRQIWAALEAGAAGYIGRTASYAELVLGIHAVRAHQAYIQPTLLGALIDRYRTRPASQPTGQIVLTARERELVQLISEGYSTQQIAQRLHISSKTVATHRENVLNKLGLKSIADLTRYAIREGLSSLELTTPADGGAANAAPAVSDACRVRALTAELEHTQRRRAETVAG